MRIGFISDFHLGFATGRRKGEDFRQAERAVKKVLSLRPDVVVFGGDLFDSPVPKPSTVVEAITLFKEFKKSGKSAEITLKSGKNEKKVEWKGIPVVAIHGTHEKRIGEETTALGILSKAELLIYLKYGHALIDGIDFYGFSGTAEQLAPKILKTLSPRPLTDTSFFIFHQNIKPFIPARFGLTLSELPPGFKYYIAGHIHKPGLFRNLLIIGSTIITQLKEGEEKKGVWLWEDGQFEFYPIKTRPFFIISVEVTGKKPSEVKTIIERKIEGLLEKCEEEPLVRVNLLGKIPPGFSPQDYLFTFDLPAIVKIFRQLEKDSPLKVQKTPAVSIDKLILDTFRKVLKEFKTIEPEEVYKALLSGNPEKIRSMVMAGVKEN